ncbi:hypothetical protein [Limnobacter alexandrii]|uniref:hypothetical protein n=1 Tax=Limnobacter alexandrii TaxID=2570352 RepID=UPI001108C1DA|nr:hypothetical protein [Limnobacter alexandrii]
MKLDLKNNSAVWITEASRLMGLAPMFAMMCAVVMLVLAVFSVNDLLQATGTEKKSQELPEFSLKKVPVGKAVYEDYARVLGRLSPDVRVVANRDSIRIEIADPSKYAEFMYVLNSIQGVSKDVVWHADEICLAGCTGSASLATVKGMTEKVEVKLRGQGDE